MRYKSVYITISLPVESSDRLKTVQTIVKSKKLKKNPSLTTNIHIPAKIEALIKNICQNENKLG